MKFDELIIILKRLYRGYVKKHFKKILIALALSLTVALNTSAIAWLLDPAVKKIFIDKDVTYAWLIPLAIIVAFTGKGASLYFARVIMIKIAAQIGGKVQQQIAQNKNLEDLVRLQSNNADFGAVNYIGREIQIKGNETHVNSQGTTWGYQFDRAATSVDLHVMDAKGRSVYSEAGNLTNSVRHKFIWDAKDASGNAIEPGKYSLRIVARDAAGNAIDSVVDSTGLVSGVKSNKTGPSLMLGENIEIALAEIMKIK